LRTKEGHQNIDPCKQTTRKFTEIKDIDALNSDGISRCPRSLPVQVPPYLVKQNGCELVADGSHDHILHGFLKFETILFSVHAFVIWCVLSTVIAPKIVVASIKQPFAAKRNCARFLPKSKTSF